jgi:hypothetical protein
MEDLSAMLEFVTKELDSRLVVLEHSSARQTADMADIHSRLVELKGAHLAAVPQHRPTLYKKCLDFCESFGRPVQASLLKVSKRTKTPSFGDLSSSSEHWEVSDFTACKGLKDLGSALLVLQQFIGPEFFLISKAITREFCTLRLDMIDSVKRHIIDLSVDSDAADAIQTHLQDWQSTSFELQSEDLSLADVQTIVTVAVFCGLRADQGDLIESAFDCLSTSPPDIRADFSLRLAAVMTVCSSELPTDTLPCLAPLRQIAEIMSVCIAKVAPDDSSCISLLDSEAERLLRLLALTEGLFS